MAGTYVSSYGNSCGRFSTGDSTTVTQTGCTITATIVGVGALTGTMEDDAVSWLIDFGTECTGTGTGTGKVDGTQITGTYAGFQNGGSCCAATVSGTFSLSLK